MKISFLDFWGAPKPFEPENNFFFYLLREIKENVSVVPPDKADVIISAKFGDGYLKYNHCLKIFYTGENVRPDLDNFDYSFTFDFDDYNGRNFRLPLWYLYIDWFNVKSYGNPEWLIPESYLYGENEFTEKEKNKFCCIVFNREVENRVRTTDLLSSYKKVDKFGGCSGGMHLPDGEKNKLDMISNYKFSICFENSLYPGYYTEKLLHAKIAGNIPIYFADDNLSKDFNIDCCINTYKMNLEEVFDTIKMIDTNDKLYNKIISEPLFNKEVSLDNIKKFFYSILT